MEAFLGQIRDELLARTYRPMRNRRKEIPKDGGHKVRVLGIPSIRDRVVQGALKLILEPIFEADFQPGSYGYRPGRTAHEAVQRVAEAIVKGLAEETFLILPHPQVAEFFRMKADDIDRWLRGMQRLNQKLTRKRKAA